MRAAGAVGIDVADGVKLDVGGDAIHEMGTARMGADPATSVLNAHNQAHEIDNLYVTDGSFMASSSCVNPSLTYMAFTARACDHAATGCAKVSWARCLVLAPGQTVLMVAPHLTWLSKPKPDKTIACGLCVSHRLSSLQKWNTAMPMFIRKLKHAMFLALVRVIVKISPQPSHMLFAGAGSSRQLCDFLVRTGIGKVLVVTDKPLRELGVVDQAVQGLVEAGVDIAYYDGVLPDPTYPRWKRVWPLCGPTAAM